MEDGFSENCFQFLPVSRCVILSGQYPDKSGQAAKQRIFHLFSAPRSDHKPYQSKHLLRIRTESGQIRTRPAREKTPCPLCLVACPKWNLGLRELQGSQEIIASSNANGRLLEFPPIEGRKRGTQTRPVEHDRPGCTGTAETAPSTLLDDRDCSVSTSKNSRLPLLRPDGFKAGCPPGFPWPDVDIPNSGPIFRIIRNILGRRQAVAAGTFRTARTGLPATTRQGTSHRVRPNRPVPLGPCPGFGGPA
jgi:hypothetical protein